MTNIEAPKVVKKKLFSPVWLLPLVALALAAWLGVKSIRESGVEIFVHFPSATGIDVGKTLVKYQGLTVGKVTDITMDEDLKGVNVTVMMDYRAEAYLRENSLFWLVSPKASITGVSGLDALFSGNYIAVQPGDGDNTNQFEALREAPPLAPGNEGLLVEISTDKLGSLDVGSAVYFRQIPVGNLVSYRLDGNKRIVLGAFIQQQYAHLVKRDSRFWNVSGLSVDASLKGIKVESESLAALLAGGISFSTTDKGDAAIHGSSFVLHDNETDALGGTNINLLADNAEGLSSGTAIMYRGIEVGKVTKTELTDKGVSLSVFINHTHGYLLGADTQFWREGADVSLSGVKNAARLVTGDVIAISPGQGQVKDSYILANKAPDVMQASKVTLTIRSDVSSGATAGTEIRYRNLPIGQINSVRLASDLSGVMYTGEIQPEFKRLLLNGSYLVPESAVSVDASLDGVKVAVGDTSALIKGALTLVPGSGAPLDANPQLTLYSSKEEVSRSKIASNRTNVVLKSSEGADVSAGSPVYYKKMQIGEVTDVSWQSKDDSFNIKLAIDNTFISLINPKTLYWKQAAVSVDASLKGLKLDVATLPGLIRGGVAIGQLEESNAKVQKHLYGSELLARAQAHPIRVNLTADARIKSGAAIRYHGHQVGEITDVRLNAELNALQAHGYLYGEYANNFTRIDSRYLLIDTEISLSGVKAPEALLEGAFLSVQPGKSSSFTNVFDVNTSQDHYALVAKDALKLTLERTTLGSIKAGSKIFFRGIAIGAVDGFELAASGNNVALYAHIAPEYRHLINASSRFFDLSGVNVEFGIFSGAKVQTGSLETILAGGIGVATEKATSTQNRLMDGRVFELFPEADKAWLNWTLQ